MIPSGVGAALSYYTQQWATVRTSAFGTLSILSNKQTVIAVAERHGSGDGRVTLWRRGTSVPTTIAAILINFRLLLRVWHAGPRRLERQHPHSCCGSGSAVRAPS